MKTGWLRAPAIVIGVAAIVGVPGGYALGNFATAAMNPAYTADAPSRAVDVASADPFADRSQQNATADTDGTGDGAISTDGAYPVDASYTQQRDGAARVSAD